MHDLARFILHFYFFLGVTAFQERIDMWQQVKRDRVRKNCSRRRCSETFDSVARPLRLRRPQGDGYSFLPPKFLFAESTLQLL